MKRLKVLISAYACEPGQGSESGVGWSVAREMAKHHDIWVLTRANNRLPIEAELERSGVPHFHFVYYDLPKWARWWKKGERGVRLYYYLWQLGAHGVARRLVREIEFDVAHHVTFVKYWAPSYLALLPVPFVWGPVGGGESAPRALWRDFSLRGRCYERLRELARLLSEYDPLVRLTARRSRVALATTTDTARRLGAVGARTVGVFPAVGLGPEEIARLRSAPNRSDDVYRLVSIGNLFLWKGFHLGLRALAAARLPDAEYWIIGEGPEGRRLRALAAALGIADRVTFFGGIPREQVLDRLQACTALVHPGLHDSGGWVCLEAMAAGKPVLCLDLGGPAVQVTPETGFKIAACSPKRAVAGLADAMQRLADDEALRRQMGEAGRRRVSEEFTWGHKGEVLNGYYAEAMR